MKKALLGLLAILILVACKNDTEKETDVVIHDEVKVSKIENKTANFPKTLVNVLEAHGGWEQWNHMNNLCFELDGKNGTETHTTDLKNRKAKIEHKDWSIGYDGNQVWLLENEEDTYSGNARFYHNLMFYFYAMPFILSDDGIVYSEMEPTELDGKLYNGIKVSYKNGVGDSPEDEYKLFFHPDTHKMEWLGYTVTFGKDEKSDKWSYIKYDDWQEVNGLQLPRKLTWYNVENGKPTDERNDLLFSKVTVSPQKLDASVFAKPEGAVVVPLN